MFKQTKAVGGGVWEINWVGNQDISGRLNVAGYLPGYHALCLGIRLDTMQFGLVRTWVPPCLGTTMPGYHAMPNVKLHTKFNSISMHFFPLLSLSLPPLSFSLYPGLMRTRGLLYPKSFVIIIIIPRPIHLLSLPPLVVTSCLSHPPLLLSLSPPPTHLPSLSPPHQLLLVAFLTPLSFSLYPPSYPPSFSPPISCY